PTSTPTLCRHLHAPVPAPSSSPPAGARIPKAAQDAIAPAPSPEADSQSNAAAALPWFTWPAVLAGATGVAATLII
uniref:Uncharacterized protein n=1 Tax=Oryza brachyantha TaxID=4533 RepID=J3M7M9_ORYBR